MALPTPIHPKLLVVDALNVCYWADKNKPTLRVLLPVLTQVKIMGVAFVAIFDGVAPYRVTPNERKVLGKLTDDMPDYFSIVTGGIRADDFVLMKAASAAGHVLSNDRYRDYAERFEWLESDPERLIKGDVVGSEIFVPSLGIALKLPRALGPALADFLAVCKRQASAHVAVAGLHSSEVAFPPTFTSYVGGARRAVPIPPLSPNEPGVTGPATPTFVDQSPERPQAPPVQLTITGAGDFRRVYYDDVVLGREELRGALPGAAARRLPSRCLSLTVGPDGVQLTALTVRPEIRVMGSVLPKGESLIPTAASYPIEIGDVALAVLVQSFHP
jgi:hypothetical protein